MFFYLVHMRSVTNALVFTKSAESTTRLVRLFEYFEQSWFTATTTSSNPTVIACAYSSDLPASERKNIFEKFKSREIHMLRYPTHAIWRCLFHFQTGLFRPHLSGYRHRPRVPRCQLWRASRYAQICASSGTNSTSWQGRLRVDIGWGTRGGFIDEAEILETHWHSFCHRRGTSSICYKRLII